MSYGQLEKSIWSVFPNLGSNNHTVTSPYDERYNCIAHAAHKSDFWWWPVKAPGVFWPLSDYMEESIECFVQAYSTLGYAICASSVLEPGVEKIAIFVDAAGKPTHAARQLSDGSWSSKLGKSHDISHQTLAVLEGVTGVGHGYGRVSVIMQRESDVT